MNILNGDAAAGSFKQAFALADNDILIFRDVLSCGALKPFESMDLWKEERFSFWDLVIQTTGSEPEDFENFSRDFYQCFNEVLDSETINLWLGCALSDQLLMIFLVYLLDKHQIDLDKLTIYQFTNISVFKKRIIYGLGELKPEQLKNTPTPLKLSKAQILECINAWEALIQPVPEQYLQIIHSDEPSLAIAHRALKALFYRYPDVNNGMSYFDEILLKHVHEHQPKTTKVIAYTLSKGWLENTVPSFDLVGDLYLYFRLQHLGRLSLDKPLVKFDKVNFSMHKTNVEISDFGLEVLNKRKNAIEYNGIDDWVCGVHLNSTQGIWYRDDKTLMYKKAN